MKAEIKTSIEGRNQDALTRASEMITMPMNKLPKLCQEYLKHLGNQVGMCMEVCLTAYAHYNQVIEGMPCENEQYKVSREGKEWFSANS